VDEICALLGYHAASSDNFLATFRDNIGPIFKGQGSGLFLCFVHVTRLYNGAVYCRNVPIEFMRQTKLYVKDVMDITLVYRI